MRNNHLSLPGLFICPPPLFLSLGLSHCSKFSGFRLMYYCYSEGRFGRRIPLLFLLKETNSVLVLYEHVPESVLGISEQKHCCSRSVYLGIHPFMQRKGLKLKQYNKYAIFSGQISLYKLISNETVAQNDSDNMSRHLLMVLRYRSAVCRAIC